MGGGGSRGASGRESEKAPTAPGPPRRNLPKPDRLHPAPWKKEPARRLPLGCSSASAGPACASSASGVWAPSVAPVRLQRPAPAKERATGVSRGPGCARRPWELAADRASRGPRSQGLRPLSPAASRGTADPAGKAAAAPTLSLPSNGWRRALAGAHPARPLSLRVQLAGPAVHQGLVAPRGAAAQPRDGGRRERESVPPSFLFRPSCDRDSTKGARMASSAALWAGVAAANRDGHLSPARLFPGPQWGRADQPSHSAPRAWAQSTGEFLKRPEAQKIGGIPAGSQQLFKRLIHSIILYPRVHLANSQLLTVPVRC